MGECQLSFRRTQPFVGLPGIERQCECARVGIANIFRCHPHHAPRHVSRIAAAIEHPGEPVQRGVGIGTAHGLVQRRDLLVEGVALPVKAPVAAGQRGRHVGGAQYPVIADQADGNFEQVQGAARVTIRAPRECEQLLPAASDPLCTESVLRVAQSGLQNIDQRIVIEWLEHIDAGPGQQGIVQRKRGILGRRADEDQSAVLDIGQKSILLGLVEAVHFVKEQYGGLPGVCLCLGDGITHFLDPGEYGGQRDKAGGAAGGKQTGNGGLAGSGGTPEDGGVQGAGQQAREWLPRTEQMSLSRHVRRSRRPHPVGQRAPGQRRSGGIDSYRRGFWRTNHDSRTRHQRRRPAMLRSQPSRIPTISATRSSPSAWRVGVKLCSTSISSP